MEELKTTEREKTYSRILITGSKGTVGSILTEYFSKKHTVFQVDLECPPDEEGSFKSDISNQSALEEVFKQVPGIDCIIHLAATASNEASWEEVLKNNIIGTYNVYECARKFGVKKVIFASSTHLFGAYEGYPQSSPLDRPIMVDDNPRPDSYYGVSKGFGELLARTYYDRYGIESVCIRIGAVAKDDKPVPPYEKLRLSHQDLITTFEQALLTDISFGIFFATSDNKGGIFDIKPIRK